jgi:hypothetical protein
MVNALKPSQTDSKTKKVHQTLHGYSEGHRLIESSLQIQANLARIMLRMSDLLGSSKVSGVDE